MAIENKVLIAAMEGIQDSDGDAKSPLGVDEARLAQMGENYDEMLLCSTLSRVLTCLK